MSIIRKNFVVFGLFAALVGCGSDDPNAPLTDADTLPATVEVSSTVGAGQYLNNRFFRLDLPLQESNGRVSGQRIDPTSIKIFKLLGPGQLGADEIMNVAVYIDSLGFGSWTEVGIDFTNPPEFGFRWQQITDFEFHTGPQVGSEVLVAIDLGSAMLSDDILAVVYAIVDENGLIIGRMGDDPHLTPPTQALPGQSGLYYRMKMLKAPASRPYRHVFAYVLRNIYSLGGMNIDPATFELHIEANDPSIRHADVDENNIPYIRIFGLDVEDPARVPGADGLLDLHDPLIFDLRRGLLKFPLDFPEPFNATQEQYKANVGHDNGGFSFETSHFLADNRIPQIYDPMVLPYEYLMYRKFLIKSSHQREVLPHETLDVVPLDRSAWSWASAPASGSDPDYVGHTGDTRQFAPEDRVKNVRWFMPRKNPSLRSHLIPDLTGAARFETQPTLDLYLRTDGAAWEAENWGGIMAGVGRLGADLFGYQAVEIWVNDQQAERQERAGKLHIDFGHISEDGFWPLRHTGIEVGTYQREDANFDGVWVFDEDIGLDGSGDNGPQLFNAAYDVHGDTPYPFINGTARNNREDDEDLNRNGRLDLENGYFTNVIDLRQTEAAVDVVYDYDNVQGLIDNNIAWRLYRIDLGDSFPINGSVAPDYNWITHVRIWYENDALVAPNTVHLQFSGLKFLR